MTARNRNKNNGSLFQEEFKLLCVPEKKEYVLGDLPLP